MVAPRLQLVVGENPLHRLRGDALDNAACDELAGQLHAVPLRQAAPKPVGPFTRELDEMYRHVRRGKKAFDHGPVCPRDLGAGAWRNA